MKLHFFSILGITALSFFTLKGQSNAQLIATSTITDDIWHQQTNPSDILWFNSVMKTTVPVQDGQQYYITNANITLAGTGTVVTTLPNALITYSSGVTTASTSYSAGNNTWYTVLPLSDAGKDVFLDGFKYQSTFTGDTHLDIHINVASNFAGGFQWQAAAAEYTSAFPAMSALTVQPDPTTGTDKAGAPQGAALATFVGGGGTGGGGSNFTGSYSSTSSVVVPIGVVPEPSTSLTLGAVGIMFLFRRRRKVSAA